MRGNSESDRNNTISTCQKSDTSKYMVSDRSAQKNIPINGISFTINISSKQKILHESGTYIYNNTYLSIKMKTHEL